METYVPYPDFDLTAKTLAVEDQLHCLDAVFGVFAVLHEIEDVRLDNIARLPIIEMWRGREVHLYKYGTALNEALDNTASVKHQKKLDRHLDWSTSGDYSMDPPRWLGDEQFHTAQRSALIRLSPDYYGDLWPAVDATVPPFWPFA